MAGAVCHELNQPMMAVSGYSELLMADMPEDNPLNGDIKQIKAQIDRMGKITRKLMRITRYEISCKAGKIMCVWGGAGQAIDCPVFSVRHQAHQVSISCG